MIRSIPTTLVWTVLTTIPLLVACSEQQHVPGPESSSIPPTTTTTTTTTPTQHHSPPRVSHVQDTGHLVAAARAVDASCPDNPFADAWAPLLASRETMRWLQPPSSDAQQQQQQPTRRHRRWWPQRHSSSSSSSSSKNKVYHVTCRTMMLDELLYQRLTMTPPTARGRHNWCSSYHTPKQVVLLGAGMDTRAWRMPVPGVEWYEVDLPDMLAAKQETLVSSRERNKTITTNRTMEPDPNHACSIHYVPLNLQTQLHELLPSLQARGWDCKAPTIFVLEGLVYYLPKSIVQQLFHEILPTVPTSRILVTTIDAPSKPPPRHSQQTTTNNTTGIHALVQSYLPDLHNIMRHQPPPPRPKWKPVTKLLVGRQGARRLLSLNLEIRVRRSKEYILEYVAI